MSKYIKSKNKIQNYSAFSGEKEQEEEDEEVNFLPLENLIIRRLFKYKELENKTTSKSKKKELLNYSNS